MMENGKLKVLSNAALKNVLGGETYNLMRTQKNADGSFTVYTFTTTSWRVANAWLNFWNAAGWVTGGNTTPNSGGGGNGGNTNINV